MLILGEGVAKESFHIIEKKMVGLGVLIFLFLERNIYYYL